MIYFLIALTFLILFIITLSKKRNEKILEEIRRNWGKKTDRYRDFDTIKEYSNRVNSKHFQKLTSQTLKDIDIENLFTVLDRTLTTIGQQLLYEKLLFPNNNLDELKEDDKKSDYFNTEVLKREAAQVILFQLENNGTSRIAQLFNSNDFGIGKYLKIYKLLTWLIIIGIISSLFISVIAVFLIPIAAVNIMIQYVFKYRNERQYETIGEVYGLIKASNRLQETDTIIKGSSITEHLKSLKPIVKDYRLLNFGIPADDLAKAMFYFLELLKACFLLELHLLNNSYSQIINQRESLKELFKYIGEFDLAISMASIKSDSNFTICIPDLISENKILKITNATHPLIDKCVPNSFSLDHRSAFITGSNMSGKSTFLRTVLINAILAQTLYICFADSYTASFLKPFSSITIEDDLLEGSSYFFEEVEVIKVMTEQVSVAAKNLFVIDETFKGTYTLERICLAKAVLEFLNKNDNIVIASSHDLELIELLSKDFEMFYFTENIHENSLNFDHTIKPGFLKTTNAIKIVELENFPRSIIDEAYKMTKEYKAGSFSIPIEK